MYNFLLASGSRFRNIIGSGSYDEHWSDMMSILQQDSSSGYLPVLSGSQLTDAESYLQNWEDNPISGSSWFDDLLTTHGGSFK